MIIRPATIEDIRQVLDDLSEQNVTELKQYGWSAGEFTDRLLDDYRCGVAHVAIEDGRPQCFSIIRPRAEGFATTFFCATREFFAKGALSIRQGREYLAAMRAAHGPLASVSTLPHKNTARWFRLLGYEERDAPDGRKIFIFA